MARKSVIGASTGRPYPQTNGWMFWMYSDDGGALVEIDRLRQNYLAQKKLKIVPMSRSAAGHRADHAALSDTPAHGISKDVFPASPGLVQ